MLALIEALSTAVRALPEYARPSRVRVVEKLPVTDGYRAIKHGLRDLDVIGGPNGYQWDTRTQRYGHASEAAPAVAEAFVS